MKFIKTKNIFTLGITISFVFFLTFINADAQEDTSSSSIDSQDGSGQLDEQIENREAKIETRQEIRAERQGTLQKIRQERILNLSANISNRMDAAITRLETITNRLESRIQKISDAGKNTEAAATKLSEAKNLINEAKAKITNIDSIVYNATTSNEPLSLWQDARQTYKETSQLIRAGRAALQETIALLKITLNQVPENNPGTSTESTIEE